MFYSDLTVSERIVKSKEYIGNAQSHNELSQLMAGRSYTTEKLTAGYAIATYAEEKNNEQIREKGDQLTATDNVTETWNEICYDFDDLRDVGRVAFKGDREKQKNMNLDQWMEKSKAKLENQIRSTLSNILAEPEMVQELSPFGFDELFLTEMMSRLNGMPALKTTQDLETNEAEKATNIRDEAMAELDEWIGDFHIIAKVALRRHPHLLELVGIQE